MRDKELKELVASLVISQKQTDRQIKQVNKQLGEIGNKWGTFAEGMAIESIKKILLEKFNADTVSERTMRRMKNDTLELDAFGYSNGTINNAVVVEIKSHLREDAIEQIEDALEKFPRFFPIHADKKLYGLIACVHAPDNLKGVLRKKGIYLAVMNDETFELQTFPNFTPRDFGARL